MDGQRQHLRLRRGALELLRGLDAVEAGHRNIQHGHVGLQRDGPGHRRLSIGCFAHDFHIGLCIDERTEAFPHDRMIVGHEYPKMLAAHVLVPMSKVS